MVTMAQRDRGAAHRGRPGTGARLSGAGISQNAFEKFETGRQTPTKEQQEKLASHFGVSLFYLRGEQRPYPAGGLDE